MNGLSPQALIEGLLFAAGEEGLSLRELAQVMEEDIDRVEFIIDEMREEWQRQGRGIQIVKVAEVYQLTTLPEHRPYFEKLAQAPGRSGLSRAALETLAIVAFRQPITRLEIEEIRGVKCERTIQSLHRKGLIQPVGRGEGVGRPILYGTTKAFLDHFGLNSLDELPAPDTLFDWVEWEEERQELFKRFGVEPEMDASDKEEHVQRKQDALEGMKK